MSEENSPENPTPQNQPSPTNPENPTPQNQPSPANPEIPTPQNQPSPTNPEIPTPQVAEESQSCPESIPPTLLSKTHPIIPLTPISNTENTNNVPAISRAEYAEIRRNLEADQMFFEADQKIKDGKTTEALAQLINLIEQFPDYGRAYNHIGFIYETKYRDPKKATLYYEHALQKAPHYPALYLNYALALSNMERFEILEELLTKALKVEGVGKDRIYNEWGIMRELQQRYEEAIVFFKKAIQFCLSENEIELYKKNIQRCRSKEELEYF